MNYFWMPYFSINALGFAVRLASQTIEVSEESPAAICSLWKSSSHANCSAWLRRDRLRPKRPVLESPSSTPITISSSPDLRHCDRIRRNSPRRPRPTSVLKISCRALPPRLTRRRYFSNELPANLRQSRMNSDALLGWISEHFGWK